MRRAVGPALIAMAAMSSTAYGHDFWLQPDMFWAPPSMRIALTLQVGDGATRERSQIQARRIIRFDVLTPDAKVIDLSARLRAGAADHDALLQFDGVGTYVLALETDNRARSYVSASAFNEYVRAEGLTPAIELRSRTGRMHEGAAERYSRCAKALFQVGDAADSSNAVAPVGVSLEIIPEANPYALPRAGELPVKVVYEGRPLAGASVKLIDLERDLTPREIRVTDSAGRASFTMPAAGSWLLSVVWTRPLTATEEVDFETIFSTLSFGFP